MSAVTIDEVKAHLRVTDGADDAVIAQKLAAAEAHVADYIGRPLAVDGTVPAPVREAVLMACAWLYDGTPADVGDLLRPYRAWAF